MAKTILFQGDSITDAGRNRNLGIDMPNTSMGGGYATIVSGELGYNFPGEYICLNRGVGGTGMASMYSRIREDLIELKPDYLSFLAGVNDAWFDLGGRDYQPVSAEKGAALFEKRYTMLLEEALEALPGLKVMILEPFTLDAHKTPYGDEGAWAETYDIFRKGVEEKALVSRKIAEKYGFPFVELQAKFDAVHDPENPRMWLWDGVHPTCNAAYLIAQEWIKGFESMVEGC